MFFTATGPVRRRPQGTRCYPQRIVFVRSHCEVFKETNRIGFVGCVFGNACAAYADAAAAPGLVGKIRRGFLTARSAVLAEPKIAPDSRC